MYTLEQTNNGRRKQENISKVLPSRREEFFLSTSPGTSRSEVIRNDQWQCGRGENTKVYRPQHMQVTQPDVAPPPPLPFLVLITLFLSARSFNSFSRFSNSCLAVTSSSLALLPYSKQTKLSCWTLNTMRSLTCISSSSHFDLRAFAWPLIFSSPREF